jgi:diguanylate cyclase (GGDEF)-like protein
MADPPRRPSLDRNGALLAVLGLGLGALGLAGLRSAMGTVYPWVHLGTGMALAAAAAVRFAVRHQRLRARARGCEEQLRRAERDLANHLAILVDGFMVVDGNNRVRICNQKALDLLGCSEEALKAVDWNHPEIQVLQVDGSAMEPARLPMNVARDRGRPVSAEILGIQPLRDGEWAWVACAAHPVLEPSGQVEEVVCILEEATGNRAAEAELVVQAFRDRLTGLPNRALFLERLGQAILRTERSSLNAAVLYLDLDRFKVVNDSLGLEAGDQLLTQVARRLVACIRPGDTVARMAGDQFAILFEDIQGVAPGLNVADRIARSNTTPFLVQEREVFLTASMGIALSTDSGTRAANLIRDAEVAMHRAKARGDRPLEVFDPSMNAQAMARLQMESEMRRGLERGEFVLHYQPLVGLKSGLIEGWEALVRWHHPERGLIQPAEFIPLAEETGLIVEVGKWALVEACRQAEHWNRSFPAKRPRPMNVNLSGRQFAHRDLVSDVAEALDRSGLDPSCLKLELTESVMMRDLSASVETMKTLKDMNIHLVVDDFGTGYSSLSYLTRFPVDTLKIDKSFVDGLGKDPETTAVVGAVISLAGALGMLVTAEGIEEPEQLLHLQRLNCDQGQGYFFSMPLAADAAETLMAKNPIW